MQKPIEKVCLLLEVALNHPELVAAFESMRKESLELERWPSPAAAARALRTAAAADAGSLALALLSLAGRGIPHGNAVAMGILWTALLPRIALRLEPCRAHLLAEEDDDGLGLFSEAFLRAAIMVLALPPAPGEVIDALVERAHIEAHVLARGRLDRGRARVVIDVSGLFAAKAVG